MPGDTVVLTELYMREFNGLQCIAWMQHSIVRRVDNALGLLLELRSEEDVPTGQDQGAAGGADDSNKGKKKNKKKQKQTGGTNAADGKAQPRAVAGYAHISAVSDTRIEKLDKVWRPHHERVFFLLLQHFDTPFKLVTLAQYLHSLNPSIPGAKSAPLKRAVLSCSL